MSGHRATMKPSCPPATRVGNSISPDAQHVDHRTNPSRSVKVNQDGLDSFDQPVRSLQPVHPNLFSLHQAGLWPIIARPQSGLCSAQVAELFDSEHLAAGLPQPRVIHGLEFGI